MTTVLFVVGLPGCGKTLYLDELQGQGFRKFDDFKANAVNNSSKFVDSQHYPTLMTALRVGTDCAVADIDFCSVTARAEAEQVIVTTVPQVSVQWRFFAKDVDRCRDNIVRRNRQSVHQDLKKLSEYAAKYAVPAGCDVLPVRGGQHEQR